MSLTDDREQKILGIIEKTRAKQGKFRDTQVTMAHGAGGKATQSMIEGLFLPAFGGETLAAMGDAGMVGDIAMTTDTFVVKPMVFPGGSIGELAVNGTVNDVAMAGAKPQAITVALVLEEGLSAVDLRYQVEAIAKAAREAGVEIVAGD
ncbi:MAG: hydrogenase expression/formation protein HypE, partial [Solirubrobacteraceae bacterium]|nr:hydrogenase expression/formation protein HypE [Solirubrobacteraceae bacterium]